MSVIGGPNAITSGLVLNLDAANSKSYPGSGTVWYDLSGYNNNMTLTNTPTFSASYAGVLQFNGTNQYGQMSALNYSTTSFSIIAGSRYSGATRGRVVTSLGNNWLLGHWGNSAERYYAEGWISNSAPNEFSDTNWRIFAATEDYSADQRSFYINNVDVVINSSAGSQGFNGISVGRHGTGQYTFEYSTCEVAFILVYNRILTRNELSQIFYATRGRFGL